MNLLLEIARCPNVVACLQYPGKLHPCSSIVASQQAASLDVYHVPEPWNGQIERAPLLFISSNPSFNKKEEFPLQSWDDSSITDYFTHRFGGGKKLWVKKGTKGLLPDGTYAKPTLFWRAVKQRAKELLDRPVKPGVDYALTEVVHCKSRRQKGVDEALIECSQRYLKRTIEISGAGVIVVLGSVARRVTKEMYGISPDDHLFRLTQVAKKERIFVFLPHPSVRIPNTFPDHYSSDELKQIRTYLYQPGV